MPRRLDDNESDGQPQRPAVARDAEGYLPRAFAGDAAARASLVRAIAPILQARVYRALSARRRSGRDIRQELEDLTQEVMVALFANDARVLRAWDPARGLSFVNYVGLVAEREVGRQLRSPRRSPWSLEPTEDAALDDAAGPAEGVEAHVASRQALGRVWSELKRRLSPRGLALFQRIFLEEDSVERVCEDFAMRPDAVYAWRSRFVKRARTLIEETEGASEVDDSSPTSSAEGSP